MPQRCLELFVASKVLTLHQVVSEPLLFVEDTMSEGKEPKREIPLRITNVEQAKLVKEQMAESRVVREESRTMKRELDRLKNKMRKGSDKESELEKIGGDEEQENIPIYQSPFLATLERVGKKGEGDLPTFYGKLDPNVCMD